MKESYLPTLLQMRMLVGFLGMSVLSTPETTAFYEGIAGSSWSLFFSKTSRLAQYHGCTGSSQAFAR